MKTSYDYYVMGCEEWGIRPQSRRRFDAAYGKYLRAMGREMQDVLDHGVRQRPRILVRWKRLQFLADLVRRGQDIADRAKLYGGDEDDPGAAGAGVREPVSPRVPVLVGCAARPLPSEDALKDPSPWRV